MSPTFLSELRLPDGRVSSLSLRRKPAVLDADLNTLSDICFSVSYLVRT